MSATPFSRRRLLAAAPLAGLAAAQTAPASASGKPAVLGGSPLRTKPFHSWPVYDQREEQALIDVVRSGHWYRGSGKRVAELERAYAQLTGAKYCLATSCGTGALMASLGALDVGAGDEVVLPPYTFVATVNVILMRHALPVFADSDIESAQIDPASIEAKISERTTAILPVHLGGNPADLDRIMPIARKHKLPVIEDACQAWIAGWRGRNVGNYGATGCFSFQASKNINCGEGGAVITNDEEIYERCYAFHWNGQGHKTARFDYTNNISGEKYCMTEFQAAVFLAQMTRLEEQSKLRDQNAAHLSSLLREIPGMTPMKMYEGCTRNAYHLYMFRYNKAQFANLSKADFCKALGAEGIPVSGGYTPLNKKQYIKNTIRARGFQRLFPKAVLDGWEERNQCPANDQLCEEALWLMQEVLLGSRSDMEDIAAAIRKVQAHAAEIARA